jgi:competence protein ComEA
MPMDRFGEWRAIEPAPDESEVKAQPTESVTKTGGADYRLVGVLAAGVLLIVGGYIWLTRSSPTNSVSMSAQAAYFDPRLPGPKASDGAPARSSASPGTVLVDVEGAVVSPGLHGVPAGSRVGDAILAAGGYSSLVDIAAAAASLNLAEPLIDGMKVHVPARGKAAPTDPAFIGGEQPAGVLQPGVGALININSATAEQLDTLPGIGPVTAAKIIAAREEAPFAAVDDLLSREVVGPATFEKIRPLVTTGP